MKKYSWCVQQPRQIDIISLMKKQTIRLCSQSPSRALLLSNAGIDFIQSPVEFDDMPCKEILLVGGFKWIK